MPASVPTDPSLGGLVLVYEYEELTLKGLFYKLQSLDGGYVSPTFGKQFVSCLFKPRNIICRFNREELEARINWRSEDLKEKKTRSGYEVDLHTSKGSLVLPPISIYANDVVPEEHKVGFYDNCITIFGTNSSVCYACDFYAKCYQDAFLCPYCGRVRPNSEKCALSGLSGSQAECCLDCKEGRIVHPGLPDI